MKKTKQDYEREDDYYEGRGHGFAILVCTLCLIIIGGGAFAGFYFLNSNNSGKNTQVERAYVTVGEITARLSDESGKKYIKANIAVGYDKTLFNKAKGQLTTDKQLPVVLDALNFSLMKKDSSYFTGDYEEKLKDELIDAVNKKVQDFKITDIKISNLIIQ
ncbi:MAG: hypothetical protein E7213_05720 [Clostridium sp.]|nr:hypothetical protein [Clostridium sp.]